MRQTRKTGLTLTPMNKTPNHQKKNKTRTRTDTEQEWAFERMLCLIGMICSLSMVVLITIITVFIIAAMDLK